MKKLIFYCIALLFTLPTIAQQKDGLLWEISGNGLKKPAYLFGTIHLYDTTLYELPQMPVQLLDKVEKVYFEMDFANLDVAEMMANLYIKDSTQYLNKLLDTPAIKHLNKLAAASPMLKMMGNQIYAIKPLLLMSILSSSTKNAVTIDYELYKATVTKKKPSGGLETVQEQMAAIDMVPIAAQTDMLKKSLRENFTMEQQLKDMTEIYVQQHIDDLSTQLNDNMPTNADFDEAIRAKRNITMADKIDLILHKEQALIAVGSGHLGNTTGLVTLLQQKGYQLKNIPFKIKKARN